MASIHNEIRRRTELLQAFSRYFELEEGSGIERVGETLTPILDLWSRIEFGALFGEVPWWTQNTSGAVALQSSWLAINNPAGSGLICIVKGWSQNALPGDVLVGSLPQATVVGGVQTSVDARDRRFGSSQSIPQIKIATGAELPTTMTTSWVDFLANTLVPIEVVISPGNNLAIERVTVNASLQAAFFGIVRRATKSELALVAAL